MTPPVQTAQGKLDECTVALEKLEAGCCNPGRSPRMRQLSETLDRIRAEVGALEGERADGQRALALIEDAGGQIGSLQVGCCAPGRMPLYAELLQGLTVTQRSVKRALGLGH